MRPKLATQSSLAFPWAACTPAYWPRIIPNARKAAILVGTVASIGPTNFARLAYEHFEAKHERFDSWDKFNREYWMTNYPDFAEHFDDGTWMICEPMAGDRLEQNLNPVGRLYYAASTMICVPTSLSQEVGTALGAQAGEARLREVILKGGFKSVRRATETPFNMIIEARP